MSISIAIRLALAAKSVSKSKGCLVAIGTLVLIPFMLIFLIILLLGSIIASIFNIFSDYNKAPYENAIKDIKTGYTIENDFSQNSLRCIDIFMDGEEMVKDELCQILKEYMIHEVVVERIKKDKDGNDIVIKETVIEFIVESDLRKVLAAPPFEFSPEDIEMVVTMPLFLEDGRYIKPIDNGRVTSPYGLRNDPFTGASSFHNGMDIVSPEWNAPVYAITNGTVWSTSASGIGGNMLTIQHDTGDGVFYAFYAHLARIDVTIGQEVTIGQVVGLEGGDPKKDPNPGSSTGQHLHFEIRTEPYPTSHTDPTEYIGSF